MFKEIVSQISFSPATVERLSDYAYATRKKQRTSGWATVILSVLLILHLFVILLPPQSSIAVTQDASIDQSSNFMSDLFDSNDESLTSQGLRFELEKIINELPTVDGTIVAIGYVALLIISLFTYLSLRHRNKEIRIIRKQLNTGGL